MPERGGAATRQPAPGLRHHASDAAAFPSHANLLDADNDLAAASADHAAGRAPACKEPRPGLSHGGANTESPRGVLPAGCGSHPPEFLLHPRPRRSATAAHVFSGGSG